jgi:hypothetical protein
VGERKAKGDHVGGMNMIEVFYMYENRNETH